MARKDYGASAKPKQRRRARFRIPEPAVFTLGAIYLAGFQLPNHRVGEAKTDLEQVIIPIRLSCETHCFRLVERIIPRLAAWVDHYLTCDFAGTTG